MADAAFVYEDTLSNHVLRADHPMRPHRLHLTYELLEAYGVFQRPDGRLVPPRTASDEEVLWFHTPAYLDVVKRLSRGEDVPDAAACNFSAHGDNPPYPGMYEASALSAGASLVAARLVADKNAPAAFNAAGGLHHAMAGHASGFCVFNDPVLAIHLLLRRGLRVAYVDIDAHHGDGVQAAFYDTDQVLTISLHESGRFLFPGTGDVTETGTGKGKGYAVNVPLYPYTTDDTYLWAFREVAPPLVRAFRPDVLVTQLGIDTHYLDQLTHLCLTTHGFTEAVREFKSLGLPWVALGGGGYELGVVPRAWTLAYAAMLDVELPDEIPAAYRATYGLDKLRDSEDGPRVEESARKQAREFAERSVAEVQRLVFPYHRLRSG
ncbi:MAG: acetoin utilization protein AcuC [Dehalococcoidia bacterium]|nr:acetoin utilization protein AcuC [Dehalococcoidia bacterium]